MAVCLVCGVSAKPAMLPSPSGLVGWVGVCQLCERTLMVYPNTQFGVNPKVATGGGFSAPLREKLSTGPH